MGGGGRWTVDFDWVIGRLSAIPSLTPLPVAAPPRW